MAISLPTFPTPWHLEKISLSRESILKRHIYIFAYLITIWRISIIRQSLAACLLICGCERASILALGMVDINEIQDLPSRLVKLDLWPILLLIQLQEKNNSSRVYPGGPCNYSIWDLSRIATLPPKQLGWRFLPCSQILESFPRRIAVSGKFWSWQFYFTKRQAHCPLVCLSLFPCLRG